MVNEDRTVHERARDAGHLHTVEDKEFVQEDLGKILTTEVYEEA